ncbi:hypothetical protein ENUP19_0121G0220 [Entamoeba nuttalli]|uniref:Poly(ADP-ribose) polymerase catalytic domain containing protein n=2 Tax=Entamoeba nuttalli TaxID=412467 RepID=K2GR89_ENTNP|nr:Poly(ADP-ribose) polymerase catalytic domain containing protein [Entamoeba nuttalli P19]EKE37478.1 Poly(ADP-ribose) polymerase catalytic domain containing protein [Entamoeba nuttalli P19]|eukprot:XP_008860182.1 Poly(ADP-ribose) polymerase catalytic domain containing protein [Entamoeba nuttalli P19]
MPPKKRHNPSSQTLDNASQITNSSDSIKTKDTLLTPPSSPKQIKLPVPLQDDLPICKFGKNCKLTNPLHFKRYYHGKDTVIDVDNMSLQDSITNIATIMKQESPQNKITLFDAYKTLLVCALEENKVSGEEKRLIRKYQHAMKIDIDQHASILGQLGWTEEDYIDGFRTVKDYDVSKEIEMSQKNEIGIIWIKNGSKEFGDEGESVFAKVHTKFFQTMSGAQSNFTIIQIGIIVNKALKMQYFAEKSILSKRGFGEEEWAFHGSSIDSIQGIIKEGFKLPDDVDTVKLDSGYFGHGIYLTYFSDYALFYSNSRNSNQMVLCQILPGNVFKCKKRMDGKKCQKGYDSHFSPKGNEIVIFDPKHILPKYIIEFKVNDAKQRQQEY